ncbi:cadherin-like domain-containing protein [Dinoroseobacter sp. PD6]|uniref:cadherin-like domain-containing protein n=1 Tax=Dinoroseobacter sp. PD6 TaxID=3028384 RepID=UPI00237B85BD|nr:cadherin-like domain-containing protein [Dinoroseobacter sp. PD6]MDD9716246.1 cadherin-like domain-containing protein [Dinoroseobacter sp. PD6]
MKILQYFAAVGGGPINTCDQAQAPSCPHDGDHWAPLAEYNLLVIELPADFSTQNPGTTLTAQIVAVSNEPVGPQASGSAILTVDLAAEGDIEITGPGTLALAENDAPGDTDEDTTSQAPLQFRPFDALQATAPDADGSEAVAQVDVTLTGLPAGATYSTGGGFVAVPVGGVLPTLTPADYTALIIQLPSDFSTASPAATLAGTVTFRTDEALLAGEGDTGPTDGVETAGFTVTVTDEADVDLRLADITVAEDAILLDPSVSEIPLNIDAVLTDIDGSETITGASIAFSGLPTGGPTTLSDGTVLAGPAATWTGSFAAMQGLGIASFPEHFLGIVTITPTVVTDEGDPAGTSATFLLNVTPVAEPEVTLSVDATEAQVTATGPDSFAVREDTSFRLLIDATTPDQDGSESLSRIVIDNVPAGWLPEGAVPPGLFETGGGDVANPTVSGGRLTITLNTGVASFAGALRVTPSENEDRDVETIVGADLAATVTAVDTATGLPDNTATAGDDTDVDLDAVVDPIDLAVADAATDENTGGRATRQLNITNVDLRDTDGSEAFESVEITLTVQTESDPYDPATLELRIGDGGISGFVTITQTGSTADTVTYEVLPVAGTTSAQFATALEALQVRVDQNFSGIIETEGTIFWSETQTGDTEIEPSDNPASEDFATTITFRPVAEAELSASVFVTDSAFSADGTTAVSGIAQNADTQASGTLTLLESTDDGSGQGQVSVLVGIDAATPDPDGSEALQSVVVSNIPTSWIDERLTGAALDPSAFFIQDGTAPLSAAEFAKIDTALYDPGTGALTLTFVPEVTAFEAAILLQPALYEDYDLDRAPGDPFTADGTFFADDISVTATTVDDNSAQTATASANVELDVDVDPVNNIATIPTIPLNFEDVVDAAGGIAQIPLSPFIRDMDGSETITAVVLKDVPDNLSVYATDPEDPTGPKVPVLPTEINSPPGFNTWSLENGQWLDAEVRGVALHAAGDFPIEIDVVTTEDDGGGTAVTTLNTVFRVEPVVDGGDPGRSVTVNEDTAIQVPIDGNLIDNPSNSPDSPEAILDVVVIREVFPDSFGRYPRFFDGEPVPVPGSPGQFTNELGLTIPLPGGAGDLTLTATQASNLWVLPGRDSNEDVSFDVQVTYFETIEPTQATIGTGRVSLDVVGVADDPIVDAQDAAAFPAPGQIDDAVFRPSEVVDGTPNSERVYGYAGFDDGPFLLDSRLQDSVITSGTLLPNPDQVFTTDGVVPLSGTGTEILVPESDPAADFDGSEVVYYVITGVPDTVSFLNASPVDLSGASFVVGVERLDQLEFVPDQGISEVTYYDMALNVIVLEDDQVLPDFTGLTPEEVFAEINSLQGGSVRSTDFTVVVVPTPGGTGPTPCTPEQDLPLPELTIEGSGPEDSVIPLTITLTPNPPFWSTIADVSTLPNGVQGSLGVGISVPAGAVLSSSVPGAVLFDPITGLYVVDFEQLGVNPSDPTQTAVPLLFTPPEHESSPTNTFDPDDTFGPADPYDELEALEFQLILNNVTCGTQTSGTGTVDLEIIPVADGPQISFAAAASVLEDTDYLPGITIEGIDPGEQPFGQVFIEVDATNGGQIFDAAGNALTGSPTADGFVRYALDQADLAGVSVRAAEHYSGPLEIRVTAASQDINLETAETTVSRVIDIIPVADLPEFIFDTSEIDPDTGAPFVDPAQTPTVIQAIEDVPYNLSTGLQAFSPDRDGSEIVSIVISGIPSYLLVQAGAGAPAGGIINNGDGSFTISEDAYPFVELVLRDEHARTPDPLDSTIADGIPLEVTVNTFELDNADQNTASTEFIFRVRPDADVPSLTASLEPETGVEDDGRAFELVLAGTTPDPHEDMEFVVSLPQGGTLFVDGVAQTAQPDGTFLLQSGVPIASPGGGGLVFGVPGTVTIAPPADFSGDFTVSAAAVTLDQSVDGSFIDRQSSDPADLDVVIIPAADLVVTQTNDTLVIDEGDPPDQPSFTPADEITIAVTDRDGSETVDSLVYTLSGVPTGTTYTVGGTQTAVTGPDLVFSGSEAEFATLDIQFPENFATNGAPLAGSLAVTTNEGGAETVSFTVDVTGELDVAVTVTPTDQAQTGMDVTVPLGIDAAVILPQPGDVETLDEVVVTFDTALPAGAVPSAGGLSGDRTTLTVSRPAATNSLDFTMLVAALAVTLPGDFSGPLSGAVTATTTHGTSAPVAFTANVNDQPVVSDPVDLGETAQTTLVVPVGTFLGNASDPDGLAGISNLVSDVGDVTAIVNGSDVEITVQNGYAGPVSFSYDISDSGSPVAVTPATATLDITVEFALAFSGGQTTGPDGTLIPVADDLDGGTGPTDVALGTAGAEAVIVDPAARDYAGIERFSMLDGNDLVDLSQAMTGFAVDLGAGDDAVRGGAGADTLTGGAGADSFALGVALDITDVITDYEAGLDQIDLSSVLTGSDTLDGRASFDDTTGTLTVLGEAAAQITAAGGGIPASVEVVFENASGAQTTAVI